MVAANGADTDQVPAAVAALTAGAQETRFISRSASAKLAATSKLISPSPKMENRERRLDRDNMNDRIKQLTWLSMSEFSDAAQKSAYRKQIHDMYILNLAASDSSSPQVHSETPASTPNSLSLAASEKQQVLTIQSLAESDSRIDMLDLRKRTSRILDAQFVTCIVPSAQVPIPVYDKHMTLVDYKLWLKHVHRLNIVTTEPKGACLFEAVVRCIQELVKTSEGASFKPLPVFELMCGDWSTATASKLRSIILVMMKSMLGCAFPALSTHFYSSFEDIILDEGEHYGIVDYALRDSGDPPQRFGTTDEFFALMSPETAYGNLSSVLAISVFCDIQVHVWVFGEDIPEVYGAVTSKFYISLFKACRGSHFDGLTWCDQKTHVFEASTRHADVQEKKHAKELQHQRESALKSKAAKEAAAAKLESERRASKLAEEARSTASAGNFGDTLLVSDIDEAQSRHLAARQKNAKGKPAAKEVVVASPTASDVSAAETASPPQAAKDSAVASSLEADAAEVDAKASAAAASPAAKPSAAPPASPPPAARPAMVAAAAAPAAAKDSAVASSLEADAAEVEANESAAAASPAAKPSPAPSASPPPAARPANKRLKAAAAAAVTAPPAAKEPPPAFAFGGAERFSPLHSVQAAAQVTAERSAAAARIPPVPQHSNAEQHRPFVSTTAANADAAAAKTVPRVQVVAAHDAATAADAAAAAPSASSQAAARPAIAATAAAAPAAPSVSPVPSHSSPRTDQEGKRRERLYKPWHKTHESFNTIKWDRDICRRESDTPAGKGIFALRNLRAGTCIALYWGHLVDENGLIQVSTNHTSCVDYHNHACADQVPVYNETV